MAAHPYISGPSNVAQTIALLRKNFPSTVTSDTIKKYGLASNNESYVINALQFIGIIDSDGKRTDKGHTTFSIHEAAEFEESFADLVRSAYSDLFDLHGEEAWQLSRQKLIGYFRQADKTSEAIGTRQAGVFRVFAAIAGRAPIEAEGPAPKKSPPKTAKPAAAKSTPKPAVQTKKVDIGTPAAAKERDFGLSVRVEINLPAGATRETYDDIFKSIRANLLDE